MITVSEATQNVFIESILLESNFNGLNNVISTVLNSVSSGGFSQKESESLDLYSRNIEEIKNRIKSLRGSKSALESLNQPTADLEKTVTAFSDRLQASEDIFASLIELLGPRWSSAMSDLIS